MKIKYINGNSNKFLNTSVLRLVPYVIISGIVFSGCSEKTVSVDDTSSYAIVSVSDTLVASSVPVESNVDTSIAQVISNNEVVCEEPALEETIVCEEDTETIVDSEEKIEKKIVALTFDDGPSKYTSELVDILNENGANATFFLIGNKIAYNSDAVVKAYTSGNEIAVHTYTHTSFTKMKISEIKDEIDMTKSLIEGLDVEVADMVRPPYGSMNDNIRESIDTSFILWSVDTRDWESRNKDSVKEEVYKAISEGDIILFHDVYQSTIDAVRELLPELSDEYMFVTVSELFEKNEMVLEPNTKYRKIKK